MVRLIAFGTDHSAFPFYEELKQYILNADPSVSVVCFNDAESVGKHTACDYPVIAQAVGEAVATRRCDLGILICGTGIGMSLAANKVPGIRAALCHDVSTARLARTHNNANVLCAGVRTSGLSSIEDIIEVYLNTEFSEADRHQSRIRLMRGMEEIYGKSGGKMLPSQL